MDKPTIWWVPTALLRTTLALLRVRTDAVGVLRREERVQSEQLSRLGQLMARYQQADRDAAVELIDFLSPLLFSFFLRSGVTEDRAEELLGNCWRLIHKSRHTYRPGMPLMRWLQAIACHTLGQLPKCAENSMMDALRIKEI